MFIQCIKDMEIIAYVDSWILTRTDDENVIS